MNLSRCETRRELTFSFLDQIERSPGDTFIYECAFDPTNGFPTPFLDTSTIIIATAGAYRPERYCYPGPRGAYAVFFGPGNHFNINGTPMPKIDGHRMSPDRSELAAGVAALRAVLSMLHRGGVLPSGQRLRGIIIKSHSEHLVYGATERYGCESVANPGPSWQESGFMTTVHDNNFCSAC